VLLVGAAQEFRSLATLLKCAPVVQAKDDPSTGNNVGPATKLLGGKDVLYTGKVSTAPATHSKSYASVLFTC
jgi:hypothetical protein